MYDFGQIFAEATSIAHALALILHVCCLLAALGSRFGFGKKNVTGAHKKDDDVASAGVGNMTGDITPETEMTAVPGVGARRRPAVARA